VAIADRSLFKTRADVLNALLTSLEGAIPDLYMGQDGVVRILFEVEAAQFENVYLANQLLLEDLFLQTASPGVLGRYGQMYGLERKSGTQAEGEVTLTGDGAVFVDTGALVGADPGQGVDVVQFFTTESGTIPDPGDPLPPVAAVGSATGQTGTYEYVVTFVTAAGETLPSDESNAVVLSNQKANLTAIPIGGPGTTKRRIYRQKNGAGDFSRVTEIADNTTTTYTDNVADGSVGVDVPTVDTAHSITVNVIATEVGTDGNIAANTMNTLVDTPSGITDVTNALPFAGGENPESDEEFRSDLEEFVRNPQTGSSTDLKFWAETILGVEEATVFNNDNEGAPTNGHATVRISGPAGAIPDADTIADVLTILNAKDLANITIHVATFTPLSQAVTCDVTTDVDHTLGDVTPSVEQAITDYINTVPVGGTLYKAGLVDAIFGLVGVIDVSVSVPATNQTAASTEKFTTGTITIS
jgi:uncharacterized phage protein gp47/JayE